MNRPGTTVNIRLNAAEAKTLAKLKQIVRREMMDTDFPARAGKVGDGFAMKTAMKHYVRTRAGKSRFPG